MCSLQRGTRGLRHRCVSLLRGKTKSTRQAVCLPVTGRPAAVDGAWHIAPLCQLLLCGVHVLDGYETLHDVFEENAHTEARDVSSSNQFSQVTATEMCTPGWVKEAGVPDCDVALFKQNRKQSPLSSFTPSVLSPARSKISKATAPPHRLWRLGRRLVTRRKRCRRFRTAAAITLPVCKKKKTNNTHTMERANRGRQMRQKSNSSCPSRTSRMQATSRTHGLDNQPSSAVGATVLRGLRGSQSEPLPALLFLQHVDVLQVIPQCLA